jgi:Tol biopolymer transport system component
VRGQGDVELGAGCCAWRLNKDELLLADEKNLKSFAASGWRQTRQWTVNASEESVFSPDGAEIVYSDSVVSGRDENGYPARTGRLCRLALDAPGGSPQVLFSEYDTGEIPRLWTRYGSLLFYKDPSFGLSVMLDGVELFSIPAAGGRPRSLGISTLTYGDWSSLSPNHDALAICVGDGRETYTNKRIAVLDLKSNAVRYLTDTKTASVMPSWSPDGKLIAYSAAPENERPDSMNPDQIDQLLFQRRIWLADPAGVQAPRRLTGDDRYRDEEPMWLADGQHLLFCRVDGARQRTLWMMRVDGTAPRQVAAALYADPDVFDVDYYGYLFWPGILDVYPGNHLSV